MYTPTSLTQSEGKIAGLTAVVFKTAAKAFSTPLIDFIAYIHERTTIEIIEEHEGAYLVLGLGDIGSYQFTWNATTLIDYLNDHEKDLIFEFTKLF